MPVFSLLLKKLPVLGSCVSHLEEFWNHARCTAILSLLSAKDLPQSFGLKCGSRLFNKNLGRKARTRSEHLRRSFAKRRLRMLYTPEITRGGKIFLLRGSGCARPGFRKFADCDLPRSHCSSGRASALSRHGRVVHFIRHAFVPKSLDDFAVINQEDAGQLE